MTVHTLKRIYVDSSTRSGTLFRTIFPCILVLCINRKVNRERNRNGSSMSDSEDNSLSGAEGRQRGKKRVTREEFNALADETHGMFNMVADMQQSLQELLERVEAQPGEDG